jgi:hypothetical protein
MNTPKSVAWGWVVFTIAGVTGSYIGYQSATRKKQDRIEEHAIRRDEQRKELERINEKRRIARAASQQQQQQQQVSNPGNNNKSS